MKVIRRILKVLFFIIVISLIVFTGAMALFPKQTSQFVGYRFYTVLSNSMEPTIPTYSIICSKVIDTDEKLNLKKGDIITFKANRFGDDVLITHQFNKMQKNDAGELFYRTNAYGKSNLDLYETRRSDIVGTYVFHIPYIGKIILYLQSPFGFIMYGELFIIWLINQIIKARWKEKDNDTKNKKDEKVMEVEQTFITSMPYEEKDIGVKKEDVDEAVSAIVSIPLYLSDIQFIQQGTACELNAVLHNDGDTECQNVFVEVRLYNEIHKEKKRFVIRVMREKVLYSRHTHSFCFRFHCEDELTNYSVKVL